MRQLAVPVLALLLAYALFFGYLAATYGELPAQVASHFDGNGAPNGWMSRAADAEIMIALALLIPGIVIGGMGGAGRIPVSFINRPHRDYWLPPERRQAALALLWRYALWFATLNVLFIAAVHALTVEANLQPPHHLNLVHFTIGLILYLALTLVWTLLLLRHFSKV